MNPPQENREGTCRTVLIYRDRLLPWSQTFITAQTGSMVRHRAVFVGTRALGSGSIETGPSITLSQRLLRGYIAEAGLKFLGIVSKEWLDRIRVVTPALVHAHFGPDGLFALPIAQKLRIPLIVTFHGYDATMRDRSSFLFWLYTRARPRLFREAACIIAVSDFIARELVARGCPPEKIRRHYIGVDTNRFRHGSEAPREPIVLFAGRLVEKKGCEYLLRAMRIVREVRADVRIVIAGDGPLRDQLESYATGTGQRVEFLGPLDPESLRNWMRRCRLLCIPSVTAPSGDSEGLPMILLEAQAMGVPVVASHHAGIPEAVQDGETGILVRERDVAGLATAIVRLMEDDELWQAMRSKARKSIEASFDLRKQTQKLEDLYDNVIAKGTAT